MSAFAVDNVTDAAVEKETSAPSSSGARTMVNLATPVQVIYHPVSGIPAEFCEFSETFDKDLPWILENCPEAVTPDVLAKLLEKASLGDGEAGADGADGGKKEKVRGGGIAAKKEKAGPGECRVVINRIQRQKRKFVTSVVGMETAPDCRLKDAAKVFGKKFASGAAVSKAANGTDEIVIQGDVQHDLPPLLIEQFKVPPTSIFFQEGNSISRYAN